MTESATPRNAELLEEADAQESYCWRVENGQGSCLAIATPSPDMVCEHCRAATLLREAAAALSQLQADLDFQHARADKWVAAYEKKCLALEDAEAAALDASPPQSARQREAQAILLIELLRYVKHKPGCLFRNASIDDSGCGMEDMSQPVVITARPCSCGLTEAIDALIPAPTDTELLEQVERAESQIRQRTGDPLHLANAIQREGSVLLDASLPTTQKHDDT